MKKVIPNIFTLFNLFFGCLSIIQSKCLECSAWFTIGSLIFDLLDGFTSRFMKTESKFGKELDSLADMVSFGIVPSIRIFILFSSMNENQKIPFIEWSSFLIPIFSACRLAQFNMDQKQYGLTTPVNALFFTSLSLIKKYTIPSNNIGILIKDIVFSPITILFIIFFSCYFLISKIPMLSLNFSGFSCKRNRKRYLFLLISIFLLLTLHIVAIPCIIIFYIIISIY
ncbi:MAG: CDP-alcohol phosphatidyltransferase family protein [Flavobacteriales bacterium]|jgi:CDP-diacylglycerol--serine O-phosphatidyltransferase|uniref:CDP-alcohol phosphatidyltransferase family protein n=1 Tax=Blattabacterium sp. (Mastotermes darwiniensis) TaxID=39768 RepID=UPI000231DE00|nr:CDP-alcohol phosphatidyltransferase family protein [Blattabacterium sp. (Mastotermes darwiniensis)]AER40564.1 CDP-diacylglycerol--serine O-phosphatidyltransferase [Blattabacterium sp. (Mastotermes darwiniensis) str. MADAR]MDR1805061.1 CDP-alcohol phosphatidyltransferase family protein [Flavobacteriales bacterium]